MISFTDSGKYFHLEKHIFTLTFNYSVIANSIKMMYTICKNHFLFK